MNDSDWLWDPLYMIQWDWEVPANLRPMVIAWIFWGRPRGKT